MAHDLDGKWHISIIREESGNVLIDPAGEFILKHKANKLDKGSVHNHQGSTHNLTGSSEPDGHGGFDISISEELPSGKHVPYFGKVIENKPSGHDRKVIGGIRLEASLMIAKAAPPPPGQIDGVWIGTQP